MGTQLILILRLFLGGGIINTIYNKLINFLKKISIKYLYIMGYTLKKLSINIALNRNFKNHFDR